MAEEVGPEKQWTVEECSVRTNGTACYTVIDGAGKRVLCGPYMSLPVAKLLAAAPKLLAACEAALQDLDDVNGMWDEANATRVDTSKCISKLRLAIAEAGGWRDCNG